VPCAQMPNCAWRARMPVGGKYWGTSYSTLIDREDR